MKNSLRIAKAIPCWSGGNGIQHNEISPLLLRTSKHETVCQTRKGAVKDVYPLVGTPRIKSVRPINRWLFPLSMLFAIH